MEICWAGSKRRCLQELRAPVLFASVRKPYTMNSTQSVDVSSPFRPSGSSCEETKQKNVVILSQCAPEVNMIEFEMGSIFPADDVVDGDYLCCIPQLRFVFFLNIYFWLSFIYFHMNINKNQPFEKPTSILKMLCPGDYFTDSTLYFKLCDKIIHSCFIKILYWLAITTNNIDLRCIPAVSL